MSAPFRQLQQYSACLLLALAPLAANAATVGGAVSVTSQLIDRGVAIAPNRLTVQGAGYWLPAPGWSVSASAAWQPSAAGDLAAFTVQGARSWMLDDRWQFQASALYYGYPADRDARAFNRQEASLAWSYRDLVTASVSTFNYPNNRDSRWRVAVDVTANLPLRHGLALALGAGSSDFPMLAYDMAGSGRYRYGQAGLRWRRAHWSVEVDRVVIAGGDGIPRGSGGLTDTPWLGLLSYTF
ncbi:hypothetical protein [Xanthomonas maliensis]|uniref:hypothetical protein n=1 Tax=Xanthomonas maliensis TaxID=1321368 RepID=UPI0003A3EEC8|nr:hypothetical protein CKY51_07360 [Xanthomonas maliensis]